MATYPLMAERVPWVLLTLLLFPTLRTLPVPAVLLLALDQLLQLLSDKVNKHRYLLLQVSLLVVVMLFVLQPTVQIAVLVKVLPLQPLAA